MAEDMSRQEEPARVRITYPVASESGSEELELPFVIGVLADLSGHAGIAKADLMARKFLEICRENFDDVLAEIGPRLNLEVESRLDQSATRLRIELYFRKLSDFEPMAILKQVVPLRNLLAETNHPGQQAANQFEGRRSDVHGLLSDQLDEILHAPEFQRLEASWRCVHSLVFETPAARCVEIRVFDVTKKELLRDQQKAVSFDQSTLFKKIHDDEYGVLGSRPFSVLIGDYDFGPKPEDMQLLKAMAKIASVAQAPFLAAANPGMFGTADFPKLHGVRNFYKIFESPIYAAWRSFRDDESSRYAGLVLPRLLMRPPYLGLSASPGDFEHNETADTATYLWGNAAYALAARLAISFTYYGWFERIAGFDRRNPMAGSPRVPLPSPDGVKEQPTDVALSDSQAKELASLGFIPVVYSEREGAAAFFAAPSCGKPARYIDSQATANAGLMVQLRYVLAASLIARYIKVIAGDRSEHMRSSSSRQEFLNNWIQRFVAPEEKTTADIYPLRDAWIEVQEHPKHRGMHFAVVFFQPNFEGEEIKAPLRIAVPLI